MKISKNRYLQGFLVVVLLLALVRVIFPSVAEPRLTAHSEGKDSTAIDSLRGDLMASAGAQDAVSCEAIRAISMILFIFAICSSLLLINGKVGFLLY